jgi:hypothetical protein
MRKALFLLATAALASAAMAMTAKADVPRYQTQTAEFTVTQPYGVVGQWQNLWTHNFTVTVNPCDGTFTGTAKQYDPAGAFYADETVTGSFSGGKINLTTTRIVEPVVWTLTGAPMDAGTTTLATTDPVVPWAVEMKVSQPQFTDLTHYRNHGDYVSQMGGGADAAHSCIGMPIVSAR